MNTCWMCDPHQYRYYGYGSWSTERVVDEVPWCYAVIPANQLVKHHILVVLKEHRDGLMKCTWSDLRDMNGMIARWCSIFKHMHYDTCYMGCYGDNGHMHYHLYPFHFDQDKGFKGKAIQWLAGKEIAADKMPLSVDEVREQYGELTQARGAW